MIVLPKSSLFILFLGFVFASSIKQAPAATSSLDNGTVQITVDLAKGGGIVGFNPSGQSANNVINIYDLGRDCQQSYYSGPSQFKPAGATQNSNWNPWPWNPVQAGDCYNNKATLISWSNDGTTLYVKSRPKQWALQNYDADCVMEQWITLSGSVATVQNRLTNARSDTTQYQAMTQELPALYTWSKLTELWTYSGTQPFTGGALTKITNTQPNWAYFRATEGWAAYTASSGSKQGVGVFLPGNCSFVGGFAGTLNSGSQTSSNTGYIAPIRYEVIDHNIVYDFTYQLILGNLADIRNWAVAHQPDLKPNFYFQGTRAGWTYQVASDSGYPIPADHLRVNVNTGDPQMWGPECSFQAADVPKIYIRATVHCSTGAPTTAQLFWEKENGASPMSEAQSYSFPLINDGQYHLYTLNLSTNATWTGQISRLRLDPVYNGTTGDYVEVSAMTSTAPGVTVTESGVSTAVTEGGATDTYTVVLTSEPTSNVTITPAPGSQLTASPASLTFTTSNWNVPQTVTVTAIDDAVAQGTRIQTITNAASSADPGYNGVGIASVNVTITDNESSFNATGTWTGAGGATWDTTATNWTGVSGTPWDSTNGPTNTAMFSAAATPTVSGTVYVNTLTIDAVTTLTGGTITLAGSSPTINGPGAGTNIIYSVLAGTNGLTKSGSGTVYLDPGNGSAANTFSGNITINGGNLITVRSNSLGDEAGAITVNSGGTLEVDWSSITRTGLVTVDGGVLRTDNGTPVFINNGSGFLLKNGGAITATLGGSGGLTVEGSNRCYLYSAGNTYTGATVIATGGDLALLYGGALPTTTALDLSGNLLAGNGNHMIGGLTGASSGRLIGDFTKTFTVNKTSGTVTYGGYLENMLTFIKDGAGTLILTHPDNNGLYGTAFPGAMTVSNGVLELGGAGRLAAGNYSGAVSLASASSVLQIATSANQTLGGAISGSGSLTMSGAGTLTVSGSNSYSGGTTVNAGTLTASHANALGDAAGAVTVNSGGFLYVNANMTRTGTVTVNGGELGTGNGSTLTINGGGFVLTGSYASAAAVLAGSSGLTASSDDARLWVQATYSGATTVNSGTLRICGSGGIPTTSAVSIASGAAVNLTSYYAPTDINRTIGGLTGSGILYGGGTGTVTVNKTSGTDTFSGDIQGAQGLIKDGAGTLELTGPNTYTGATAVNLGTLALVGGSQASPITVSSGAALGFTLGSPTTSSSTVTFSGATAKVSVTGTPAAATLMTATSITGTPVLDPAIPGFSLAIEDGATTLKLKSSGTTYAAWQSANSTTGAINADHDNDGVPNGVEYFLMGATNSTGFTALPPVDNSGGTLSVTWTKAAGYSGSYGTGFRVETSTTLANPWTPATMGVGPGFVEIIGNNVKYTFPAGPVRSFARLVVTGP